ncbi:hypothetical protein [uncultured Methanobrevibacter sp.]|uniref:hypothetical protein n=1 Tax=uncultured Methanobrevibacter sp. TaxID=253161 RepID=UPI00261CB65D|nr:hypothetical protein [uncultured Methanobrevibacter sp.]
MDMKKFVIIVMVLMIISVILISHGYFMVDSGEKTNLTIVSDNNLTNGDIFSVKLTNESGDGIENKVININLTDSNKKTTSFNITTDSQGGSNFTINLNPDNYTVNVSFSGDKDYKYSFALQNLTIEEIIIKTNSPESSYHSSSSTINNDYDDGIVYSTDPNSDKSVLDEYDNIDQNKVNYYNQKALEKYGPIG